MVANETAITRMNADYEPRAQFDHLPPHSIEAEMCVIGSMLLAGGDPDLFQSIRTSVGRDDFFQVDHQIIFDAMIEMSERGQAVDPLTVRLELVKRQTLEEVGGIRYLAAIISSVPAASHGPHYARTVRQMSGLRRMITIANETLRKCYEPTANADPAADIAAWMSEQIVRVISSDSSDHCFTIAQVMDEIEDRRRMGIEERSPTGQGKLDQLIGGLPWGGMTLIAGRPSMGKSQELKQLVLNYARNGIKCGIISIEETRLKVGRNMLANVSGVRNSRIAYGQVDQQEEESLTFGANDLRTLPIVMNDAAFLLSEVLAAATRMIVRHKCRVVVLDYLQLVTVDDVDRASKEEQISRISVALKNTWKRFNVLGICAAQLNRGNETQGVREPVLSDLRGSGQLDQDADVAILLHREDYYHQKEEGYQPTNVVKLIVAKNRDGPCGFVNMRFDGSAQSITDFEGGSPVSPVKSEPGKPEKLMTDAQAGELAGKLPSMFKGGGLTADMGKAIRLAFRDYTYSSARAIIGRESLAHKPGTPFDLNALLDKLDAAKNGSFNSEDVP